MKLFSLGLMVALFCAGTSVRAEDNDAKAKQLAHDVWQASGGENWPAVKQLQFTFIVEKDGQQLASAEHHWDMATGMDEVKWKDKDAKVNVSKPAEDDLSKSAYARWTNDSYWLLAPLKILDPGVKLSYEGEKVADGAKYETLLVSFENVGLTPGDQYRLYIDPETKLVRAWDYMPKPDTTMHATWDKYQDFGGLKLATEHVFGDKMIRFADVKVTR